MNRIRIFIYWLATLAFLLPSMALANEKNKVGRVFYNPLATSGDKASTRILPVSELVGRLIYSFLVLAGIIATLNIIRAGVMIGTSAGNSERLEKGKKGLIFSIVGLLVTFFGFIVVNFFISGIASFIPGLGR